MLSKCPVDSHCAEWAIRYLGLCLCNTRDGVSFALGLISVISWSVAEIPQIITNYRNKSAEGLSIFFLLTWIAGDFFNLFGCLLEPATLPTQYYVALLYTITTLTLAVQALYYGHIYPQLKIRKRRQEAKVTVEKTMEHNHVVDSENVNDIKWQPFRSSPVPLPSISENSDLYIMSARSLSVSYSPTRGSFSAMKTSNADVESNGFKEPLLGDIRPIQSAPTKIKCTLCVISLMTIFLGGCDYKLVKNHKNDMVLNNSTRGVVFSVGRRLLKGTGALGHKTYATESSGFGSFLGWGMTAIYMGGRLPQIYLNIKRGTAEGLNPLMFVFALFGNLTYVGSILVHSTSWTIIKPNLPWLVDAFGCVVLDICIISQSIYFFYRSRN